MPAKVQIFVDSKGAQLELDSFSEKVFGPIYVELDEEAFPAPDWTDFVVTVLTAWAAAISRLVADSSYIAECPFMDGPYWLELRHDSSKTWQVTGYKRTKADPKMELLDCTVVASDFVTQFSAAAKAVLAECKRRKWANSDIERLSTAMTSLEAKSIH